MGLTYLGTASPLPAPQILRVLKLYYQVANSHLSAPQILRVQIALSPAFRALDTRDLRRGLHGHRTNRTLVCISRAISAEGCARMGQIALSPAFRTLDTHDLRKSCASSLQNERFVRDFLKNSHVKVCKTSVSYETSSKSQAETPIGEHTHTHITQPCRPVSRFQPLQATSAHTPIPM